MVATHHKSGDDGFLVFASMLNPRERTAREYRKQNITLDWPAEQRMEANSGETAPLDAKIDSGLFPIGMSIYGLVGFYEH